MTSPYKIQAGIQVSLDGVTWYSITDHNRAEIDVSYTLIEKSARMANAKMRKYVVDKKRMLATSWTDLPSSSASTVDSYYSSAWLTEFYVANVGLPIYLKLVHSKDTSVSTNSYPNDATFLAAKFTSEVINVFITKFDVKIKKRTTNFDYVNMDIEFTEI
jgi:hypothetical protein